MCFNLCSSSTDDLHTCQTDTFGRRDRKNKCRLTIRLLKDTGAEDTLITTEAAQAAGLKLTNTYIETETFSGQPGPPITKTTTLTIAKVGEEPTTENSITINNVLVTKSVGSLVPRKTC
jgi:hypothetical protein